MSNLARKLHQKQVTDSQPRPSNKKKQKRASKITPFEKLLYVSFIIVCFVIGTKIIKTQAAIYNTNLEIQNVKNEVAKEKQHNSELKMKIDELSTYERIWQKAKELGLNIDSNNVKFTDTTSN
ncbi:cell division protein FtsL [Gottfriedia luciferensis]|uniref:cell division protein FtsL n=1 Tax=Gottfriedia luciferensis TaxID=178774 RepID=UPI0013028894|nr:cell division protein FtsL [Gottfriedia luciferensis]